ncbi:MAG: DinB family protein [Pyrinomonadaceae bacterium]
MQTNTELKTIHARRLDRHSLLQGLADELLKGIDAIAQIDDETFRRSANGTGSVGEQFRHNLDVLNCLLNGLKLGRIDYAKRERNPRIEIDREFAANKFREVIERLRDSSEKELPRIIMVRSETDPSIWLPSSVAREVEFVHSHTVHHHALISEKLAGFGMNSIENFGVASSTLEFWKSEKIAAKPA